jgi:uncharacterized protein (DUF4415 family)
MPKLKAGTILPTDQENTIITRQAKEDGTLLGDAELAEMKPLSAFPELQALVKRGRPPKSRTKQSTTLRLSAEVLEFFKAGGKGWQSRIDAVLKEHVNGQHSLRRG